MIRDRHANVNGIERCRGRDEEKLRGIKRGEGILHDIKRD